jgi:hypothetical protein
MSIVEARCVGRQGVQQNERKTQLFVTDAVLVDSAIVVLCPL